ncbi:MAG: helix-turn-helix transcriptional regulator [Candidatus Kapabacteria bacterium]|jgi:DNA-binding HxlR family transcriptional regulator|nr:helix-turn-helix transcriptional regulator [Candidatus Kapabacteria bacterium]
MPDFIYNGTTYHNPVEFVLDLLGGKWKMPILWRLRERSMRYGELRDDIPSITTKMLTQQLRDLERHGFISRTVHPVVPPHVDYALTERGRGTIQVINSLRDYGLVLMEEVSISIPANTSRNKRSAGKRL